MPMNVSIDINGRKIHSVRIRNLGPTTPEESLDYGGERTYECVRVDHESGNETIAHVTHRRDSGALHLVRSAIDAIEN